MLPGKRLVDLSEEMTPGKEEYGLSIESKFVDEVLQGYRRREDVWYILQTVTMSSHVGTHIEMPYHHLRNGVDAAAFPLEPLIGEGVVLDFRHKADNEAIDVADLESYDEIIRAGDIVLIHTGRSAFYGTDKAHQRPFCTTPAVQWLVDKGIACVGIDATGLEIKGTDDQPNHTLLFRNNIPLIESVAHLEDLRKQRFQVFVLPLRMKGLDSSPIRLIALEDVE